MITIIICQFNGLQLLFEVRELSLKLLVHFLEGGTLLNVVRVLSLVLNRHLKWLQFLLYYSKILFELTVIASTSSDYLSLYNLKQRIMIWLKV
jgi:hypothetical protein